MCDPKNRDMTLGLAPEVRREDGGVGGGGWGGGQRARPPAGTLPLHTPDFPPCLQFFEDFDDMLAKAAAAGLKVMPVLWDFIAMNAPGKGDKPTRTQGLRGALFTDPDLANAFMENALRPLVQRCDGGELWEEGVRVGEGGEGAPPARARARPPPSHPAPPPGTHLPSYAGHPALLAWDIFNEPEWCVAETGEATTTQKLPLAALQTFIGRAASIIHSDGGGVLATVGSASVKWGWEHAATRPDWCMDLWGDDKAGCRGGRGVRRRAWRAVVACGDGVRVAWRRPPAAPPRFH